MQILPLLQKYFEPPPPRNEILDTPLSEFIDYDVLYGFNSVSK